MLYTLFPESGPPQEVEAPTPEAALLTYAAVKGERCMIQAQDYDESFIFIGFRWAKYEGHISEQMKQARRGYAQRQTEYAADVKKREEAGLPPVVPVLVPRGI
jgi:hypothetical protein